MALYKYAFFPFLYYWLEMHAGCIACCRLMNHVEYAPHVLLMLEKDGTDRQTDRQMDRYMTFSARCGQLNKSFFGTVKEKKKSAGIEFSHAVMMLIPAEHVQCLHRVSNRSSPAFCRALAVFSVPPCDVPAAVSRRKKFCTDCSATESVRCFRDEYCVDCRVVEYAVDTQNLNLSAIRTIRVLRPLRAINRIPSKSPLNFLYRMGQK